MIILISIGLGNVAPAYPLSNSWVNMPFQRPHSAHTLTRDERAALILDYLNHYRDVAKIDPGALNRKVAREAFDNLLNQIGSLLLERSVALASEPGPVRDFLIENPLPKPLEGLLPDEFRVFCLSLNALKQWLSAEQAAADRYLLGGKAREECRQAVTTCLVTGDLLDSVKVEFHHPVRDGRPPIPLSKQGHERIEGQLGSPINDSTQGKIYSIRKRMNRSWVHLRKGCLTMLGIETSFSTSNVAASAKAFARKVSQETGLTPEQILAWLDMNSL